MIYLDNAATSFPKSEAVLSEMDRVNRYCAVNAGRGSYRAARDAMDIIASTRDSLLSLFDANGIAEVIMTPSITHALNQVINGLELRETSIVYISPYEHNAVVRTLELLKSHIGFDIQILPLNESYEIDLERVKYDFSVKHPDALIINMMSNVTGYVLPVAELISLAKSFDAITVIDTAQAAGLIDISMRKLQVDIICFAGHKSLGGPFGIGGFVLRDGLKLRQSFAGGTGSDSLNTDMPTQAPYAYEAASPNISAIAGLKIALDELNVSEHYSKVRDLTLYLLDKLSQIPKVQVVGHTRNQIGVVSFVVEGYNSNDVGEILDNEFDIAVRTGYHCCPYVHQYIGDVSFGGTIRIGLGQTNTFNEIDCLIDALNTL